MNAIIENNKVQINQLCVANKVQKLYVFGSVLTDNFNKDSDLDFLVTIDSDDPLKYTDHYFNLLYGFENLFGKNIDLLEAKTLQNPYLKQNIDSKKVLIYG